MKFLFYNLRCISILILFPFGLFAQQIAGTITNAKNGNTIQSANIILEPGGIGTVANAHGNFFFKGLQAGKYKITVSNVGFISKTIHVFVSEGETTNVTINIQPENKKIDEVQVVGNYHQSVILEDPTIERSAIMPTMNKVSAVEIQKQGASTLIETLKYIPGAWTETRGRKVKQFFSIRGQKYPYPSYSINGIWQKEFAEMPYFFNSSNIEEVKVIRSSAALVKSLSALSGIIDVKTKQPRSKETGLYLKYGSLNSYHSSVSHGNAFEKVSYRVGANAIGTNGPAGRNGKEEIWNMNGTFNWTINNKTDFDLNVFYLNGMRQLIQPIEPAASKFRNQKEKYDPYSSLMISSKLIYRPSEQLTSELQVNYAGRNPKYMNENLQSGAITEYNEKDYEITLNEINALAIGAQNTLRFGALYNYWQAPEGKRFYSGRKAEVHTVSGVVTDQHSFGKLLLDAGFRLTQEYYAEWGGFSIEGSGGKFSKVAPITNQWQAPVWQATTGLSYNFFTKSSLNFSVAAGIVNPRKGALTENATTPENETRANFDLGYITNFQGGGKIAVSTYLVNRKSAIEFSGGTIETADNEIMELYQNSDKRNYGVELDFRSPVFLNNFTIFSNITLMKGEVEDEDKWQKDDEMPNVVFNLGTNFQKERFDVNAYLNYTGKYKNNRFVDKNYLTEFGKAPLGDFATIDLTAGYSMGKEKKTRIFIEGKNLFDTAFQTVPGYPDYGRIISVGFSLKL